MNMGFLAALTLMTLVAVGILVYPFLGRAGTPSRSRLPYLAAALLVPVLAIVIYAVTGDPDSADAGPGTMPPAATRSQPPASKQDGIAPVANLVDGLAARLEHEPDDAGGWLLLAKSYRHLDRREDARSAYLKARDLGRIDADLEAYLDGAAAMPAAAAASAAPAVSGRVSIAGDKAGELDGADTVFIVARAASGSPVPLAVVRTTVADLPFEFRMTDADAMVAGNNLSSAGSIVVSAKVSAEGDAMRTLPGFDVVSDPFDAGESRYLELELGSK